MEGRRAASSPAVGSLLRAFLLLQALLFSNGQAQPAVAKPVVAKPAGAAYTGDISDYRKGLFSRLEDAAGATEAHSVATQNSEVSTCHSAVECHVAFSLMKL